MTKHRERTIVPGQGWVTIAVVVGICLVILTIVLPAILDAREATRMVQSRNNLKQFALAFHNYHDVYQVLPIGGDIDTDGTAKHSWFTRCIPYLAEQYPETQKLIMPRMSPGDEHVIELPLFLKLKVLSIAEIRLTEQGFAALHQLKTLRHLIVRAEDSELRKLRMALPDCEFTLR